MVKTAVVADTERKHRMPKRLTTPNFSLTKKHQKGPKGRKPPNLVEKVVLLVLLLLVIIKH